MVDARKSVLLLVCGALLLAFVLLAAGCATSDSVLPPAGDRLATGEWGGDDAGIRVDSLTAHVHIGCTFGNFAMPVTLDANRRFSVTGSYVLRAYPIQLGPSLPAQFAGVIEGNRLTFTVAVNDTVEKKIVALGPATVFYRQPASMRNCPICTNDGVNSR